MRQLLIDLGCNVTTANAVGGNSATPNTFISNATTAKPFGNNVTIANAFGGNSAAPNTFIGITCCPLLETSWTPYLNIAYIHTENVYGCQILTLISLVVVISSFLVFSLYL